MVWSGLRGNTTVPGSSSPWPMGTLVLSTFFRPKRLMICASDVRAVRSPAPLPGLMTKRGSAAEPPGAGRRAVSTTRVTPAASRIDRMVCIQCPTRDPRARIWHVPHGRGGSPMAYDYAIVGAGSAGCVLASRLTEDPAVRVLLLEAGEPDHRREVRIPAAFKNLFRTECDWSYETQAQPSCAARVMYWPRGKMVGGCSSMNAMIYIRG